MIDDGRPIFLQIAEQIEGDVLDHTLAEETQAPSTNEIAAFYRINPATAAKGVNQLVADGVLYKKRGIGMFVSTGARQQLLAKRRREFAQEYVVPLVAQAERLGIDDEELVTIIKQERSDQ
ncbi:MAG: GntR family transcriptional regulator [Nocardioidaceae bacterium]